MATGTQSARTFDQYKAERRKAPPSSNPLDDYRPQEVAKASARGVPRDWPFCTCGAEVCPDKGLT
ncbi:hypothetical protein ACWC5I_12965 [Kitasatospora sp. NPDC001574]